MNIKQLFLINSNIKSYLALFFIALFMLGANPFKSETIAPMDLLVKYPGWQNTNIHIDYINGERSDVLDAKLPIWISAKRTLRKGEIPFWNHQRAGKPGLTFTNSLFTPAFVTFALFEDDALGFYLSNLVNVLIGLIGMFLFLRLFFNTYASIFGAFVFMFSGFNTAWFYWAHVNTAIWTPWVLYAVYKYINTLEKKHLIAVTLSMLMLNLGGFPMIAVMTYISVAIMVFVFLVSKKYSLKLWIQILTHLIIFSMLAVLIAIPFLYSLIVLLEWMGGVGYRSIGPGFSSIDFQLFYNPYLYRVPTVEKTFFVGILPLVFLCLTFIYTLFRPSRFAIFSLLLFILSLSLSFKLIDENIIKQIPIINSSMVTRFSYLIDVSLALISAFFIHLLASKIKHKYLLLLLVTLLFSIQIFQQKSLFNEFNGAVPNKSFYAKTESIRYLQENLKPLEHVISDRSFLISGTLGGYGINDWFAHSFHNVNEKELLRKIVNEPFKTPTAAMFDFSQINLESPYLDYLGIKALLTTYDISYEPIEFIDNTRKRKPSPTLPYHTLSQPLHLTTPYTIDGIQLLIGTYGEKHAFADVLLTLKKEGKILEETVAQKTSITDNKWVNFLFKAPLTLTEGDYTISVEYNSTQVIDVPALIIWSSVGEKQYKLNVNGKPEDIAFQMRFIKHRKNSKQYTVHNLEPNVYILEKNAIKENAYFMTELSELYKPNYDVIKTNYFSNNKMSFQYMSNKNGWVVLPMRHYPGWHATVNGNEMKIESFLGILPAVKVDKKSEVVFSYIPKNAYYTYTVSLLSFLILLFLAIRLYWKKDDRY